MPDVATVVLGVLFCPQGYMVKQPISVNRRMPSTWFWHWTSLVMLVLVKKIMPNATGRTFAVDESRNEGTLVESLLPLEGQTPFRWF